MTLKDLRLKDIPVLLLPALLPLTAYMAYREGVTALIFYGLTVLADIAAACSVFFTIRTRKQAEKNDKIASDKYGHLRNYIDASWESNERMLHEEKIRAVQFMMMGISHEVNTPIGNALTSVSILDNLLAKNKIVDRDIQSALELSLSSIKKTIDLISRFKEVAQISLKEDKKSFLLADFLEKIGNLKNHEWAEKKIRLKIDCPADYKLSSYPHSLGVVLMILLDNAYDSLADKSSEIELICLKKDRDIQLTVKDRGKGIKRENLGKIFTPFYTTARGEDHLGLGLSTAHNLIVNLFGGEIFIESEPDRGTEVTIGLPEVFAPAKVILA